MIRKRKVVAVLSFEFMSTVRRRGYLIATLGMPVFMLLYMGVIGLISGTALHNKIGESRTYGMVDRAGILRLSGDTAAAPERSAASSAPVPTQVSPAGDEHAFVRGAVLFRPFPTEQVANDALLAREVHGYYVISADYLSSGRVDATLSEGTLVESAGAGPELARLLVQRLLAGRVPAELSERINHPMASGSRWMVGPKGERQQHSATGKLAKFALPLSFAFLMMISLAVSSGYLLQAVATEKENKVVEVLLSSVDPDEILLGKLMGLGGAGLIQVGVWFCMAAVGGAASAAMLSMVDFHVAWLALGLGVVYFVLGYLVVGSLMIGTASLGSTMRESQQLGMIWTLLTLMPLIVLSAFIAEPNGTTAKVMSWIPFTSPLTMELRLALAPQGVGWWEIVGTLLMLLVSIWASIHVGARLFRVGVLLSGSRPSMREILRQAMLAPKRR